MDDDLQAAVMVAGGGHAAEPAAAAGVVAEWGAAAVSEGVPPMERGAGVGDSTRPAQHPPVPRAISGGGGGGGGGGGERTRSASGCARYLQ